MKRAWAVFFATWLVGATAVQGAGTDASNGVITTLKADVLVEVQQVPLECFGTPANTPKQDRWSTWLVRLTNRSKYPIFVQVPHPRSQWLLDRVGPTKPAELQGIATASVSYDNWILQDGERKTVGTVRVWGPHKSSSDPSPRAGQEAALAPLFPSPFHGPPVFDYLLHEKTLLADPRYMLQAPPRCQTLALWDALVLLFQGRRSTADALLRSAARQADRDPSGPEAMKPWSCPALWPGETTWGYLVFWRHTMTRSSKLIPRGYFGRGVTWALAENPRLLDELTVPNK